MNKEVSQSELFALLGTSILNECTIEITNICPFFCDHCYVEKSVKTKMNFKQFKQIIDQLLEINCYSILITGGEPMSNPEFVKMYKYAKTNGMFVNINTNGYLIDERTIDILNKYKPNSVEISLYGYNEETYYNFVHIKNAYSKVLNNIKLLKHANIKVGLKSVLTKKNYQYINKIKELANLLELPFRYDYIIFPKVGVKTKLNNPELLNEREIIEVIKQDKKDILYFKTAVKEVEKYKSKDNTINQIFQCSIGKNKIFIDCNGNIKLCLVVPIIRNINEYSIKDAIEEMTKDIEAMKISNNSKCKNCYKRNICRYCPGRFFLETGKYDEAPEFYCNMADALIKEFKEK